tara:strand:- start:255 stop:476 length:222 start_codon:yes stop_codon:yes gene_type:complete
MDITELNLKFNRIIKESIILDKETNSLETNLTWKHPDYNCFKGTYLESKNDIIDLYKLFIFYGLMESYFDNYN